MMKATIALFALMGVVTVLGNPAADTEWRWKARMPTVSTNPRAMHFGKYIGKHMKQPFVPGTKTVAGCGRTKMSPKIVGGEEVEPHSLPWQVGLFIDDTYFCGGSIINEEWILTAGHCLEGALRTEVVAGAHNIQTDEDSQVTIISTDLFPHEGYNSLTLANDLSLLHLPTPLTFNENIAPVCLPSYSSEQLPAGTIVSPSGWGKTSDDIFGGISPTLNKATNPMISKASCAKFYGAIISDSIMCTSTSNGQGTCSGDSGGPLNYHADGVTYTRGITSFGSSAGCLAGHPDGFTRVNSFLDWIETKTGIAIDP